MSNLIEKTLANLSSTVQPVPVLVENDVLYISELSKQTLGSYIKKSADDARGRSFNAGHISSNLSSNGLEAFQKQAKKSAKRQRSIVRATDKLTKEDIEGFLESAEFQTLDELSKKTLSSYAKKASRDAVHRAKFYTTDMKNGVFPKSKAKIDKREAGVNDAINRLTREDIEYMIENVDQLSHEEKQQLVEMMLYEAKPHKPGYVAVAVNGNYPDVRKYTVFFKPDSNSPRGRTKAIDISHHDDEQEAKSSADAYANKHGLHRLKEDIDYMLENIDFLSLEERDALIDVMLDENMFSVYAPKDKNKPHIQHLISKHSDLDSAKAEASKHISSLPDNQKQHVTVFGKRRKYWVHNGSWQSIKD